MIVFAVLRTLAKVIRDARRAWRIEEAWHRDMLKVFVGRKRLRPGDECPQCEGRKRINVTGRSNAGPLGWEDCDLCHGAGVLGNNRRALG